MITATSFLIVMFGCIYGAIRPLAPTPSRMLARWLMEASDIVALVVAVGALGVAIRNVLH